VLFSDTPENAEEKPVSKGRPNVVKPNTLGLKICVE